VAAFKNEEREKVAVFSNRPTIVPGYRILILTDRLPQFSPFLTHDGAVDLSLLAETKTLRGAYVASRPLFGVLEDFVNAPNRSVKLEKLPQATQLTNLVISGHIDFAIVPGIEVNFYTSKYRESHAFTAIPVMGMPVTLRSYVACSNSNIGRDIMTKVNEVIDDDHQWARFVRPLLQWGEPASNALSLGGKPESGHPH
jgi:uncharacterized protein (TIGR02285 family)